MKRNKMIRIACFGLSLAVSLLLSSCQGLIDTRVEFEHFESTEPVDGLTELQVSLDYTLGMLEIRRGDAEVLYALDLDYDRLHFRPDLTTERTDSRGSLRFDMESIGTGFGSGTFENDLVLELSGQVNLDLEISTGVADSFIDLSGLRTESLRFNGGVGRAELVFYETAIQEMDRMDISSGVGDISILGIGNAELGELRFSGGVGSAELDFTGDWGEWLTTVEVSVGLGKVDLIVPRELPVEISSGDSLLSNVDAPAFRRDGDRYTRNVSASQAARLMIRIDSGVGRVEVDLR